MANIPAPGINTENLRDLQTERYLDKLLQEINAKNNEQSEKYSLPKRNIFLKIAPDLTDEELENIFSKVKNTVFKKNLL